MVAWALITCVVIPVAAVCSLLIWVYFTNNWHPPEMFSHLFASGDQGDQTAQDKAITQILQRTFPLGTTVGDLKSSLSKEGFQVIPPPPPVRNQMEYQWMIGGICRAHIYVKWMTAEDGKVSRIQGYGSTACL